MRAPRSGDCRVIRAGRYRKAIDIRGDAVTDLLVRPMDDLRSGEPLAYAALPSRVRVRGSAYGVIAECLRIQSDVRSLPLPKFILGFSPLSSASRAWYRAALDEVRVVRALGDLGTQFTLLHPEPGTAECDYLVIGPTGVFTVTTKNHSGQRVLVDEEQLLVNGRRTHHLLDARFESSRVSKLLSTKASESIAVNPLIAVVDPGSLAFGRRRPRDVTVAASSQAVRFITRRPRALSASQVSDLVDAAERSGAWHAAEHVVDDTLRHEARFTRLRYDVDAAARRRVAWIALGLAATAAAIVGAILLLG